MTKVTNKHNAPLIVAGVEVRPQTTVKVPDADFEKWSNGNAAKQWLKLRLIETGDAPAVAVDTDDEGDDTPADDREALLQEARDLGLNPNANTGVEKLKKMIADKKAG